jgi:quercetin dioxygenase-like cupin family protein
MLQPGRVLLNRVNGQSLIFRRTGAQTMGRILEVEIAYPPGGHQPPDHIHPEQEATLELLEGALRVRLNGRLREVAAGEVLILQAGVRHAAWNPGPTPARGVWLTYPALDTESLLKALWALGQTHLTNPRTLRDLFQAAVVLRAYRRELQLACRPRVVHNAVLIALASIGRGLGYESRRTYELDQDER